MYHRSPGVGQQFLALSRITASPTLRAIATPTDKVLHTLIIGAGQAGLAAAYYLKVADVPFVILDANERVGDSWRKRWKGLELFTPQRYNQLPGLPPPTTDWRLIDRLAAADYLEGYARHFSLPVHLHRTCVSAKKKAHWVIETNEETYHSERLIVATGAYKDAFVPAKISATFPASVRQYHSSEVRDMEDIAGAGTSLLIVGAGASGQQLCRLGADAGAEVGLIGPEVPNLPRTLLGKDIYWWLYKSGAMSVKTNGPLGKLVAGEKKGVVTVGERRLPPAVNRYVSHLREYADGHLHFTGEAAPVRWPGNGKTGVVIWCTGFRNRYPFLPAEALAGDGRPLHQDGISETYASLVFVGLENLRRPKSSLLGGVKTDAKEVVSALLE